MQKKTKVALPKVPKKNTKSKKSEQGWSKSLPINELARWGALVEGINLIADAAEDKNIPFESISLHIPEIKKYIESTSDIIAKAFTQNDDKR